MGTEQQAGVGLRITQISTLSGAPGQDLATIDTTEMPNGALAFIDSNRTLYALDRESALVPNGTSVLTALGGGQWVAVVGGSSVYSANVQWVIATGSGSTGALTQGVWTALPQTSLQYTRVGSTLWSAGSTDGVFTYAGPTRDFIVMGSLTAQAGSGTTTNFGFSFSRSDAAIIGTGTIPNISAQVETAASEENNWSFVGMVTTVVSGQTFQGCVINRDGVDPLTILAYSLVFIPAS